MYLISSELAQYLTARGLVTFETVVDGQYIVAEASGRHRTFRVTSRPQRGLFVKQVRGTADELLDSLRREAACYQRIHSDQNLATVRELPPSSSITIRCDTYLRLGSLMERRTSSNSHGCRGSLPST